jgi:hypothetical protein
MNNLEALYSVCALTALIVTELSQSKCEVSTTCSGYLEPSKDNKIQLSAAIIFAVEETSN